MNAQVNGANGSVFEQYNKLEEEKNALEMSTPIDFDIVEGGSITEYDDKLKEIAFGEILAKDVDKNGSLNYEEYTLAEVADLGEKPSEDEILDTLIGSYYLFNGIDALGEDGEITSDELMTYYEEMDRFDGLDGYINSFASANFIENKMIAGMEKIDGNVDAQQIMSLFMDIAS